MQSDIKVYEGEDLQELINMAKKDLGDKIKILHYEEFYETKWWLPFFKKKKYKLFVEKENIKQQAQPLIDFKEILAKVEEIIEEKIKTITPQITEPPPHIQNTQKSIHYNELKDFTGEAIELIETLLDRGVDLDVAKQIVEPACGLDFETNKMDLNTATFKEALIKGIKEKIKFVSFDIQKSENKFKVITFVGPTGVGKTTNLFKIASNLILKKDLKVGVISTDTFKVGSIQQARFYANILNIPFYTIGDSKRLRKTLLELSDIDVVLIDTLGSSHYDSWKLGEIKEVLRGGFDWMEAVLTISCNFNPEEAINVINTYRTYFPIRSILFTKIDEVSKPGLLLNLPIKANLPVSFISTGQKVPEDIEILTPENMAKYILGE